MVESGIGYEQIRQKRLEENKKRMEELNLNKLAFALRTSSPKRSPMKLAKPRTPKKPLDLSSVRRSSRMANKPLPSYKEIGIEPHSKPRKYGSGKTRDLSNRVYASDEERAYAIERAEELQASLDSEFPSFIKPMLQSHVTGGFWLGLPLWFCRRHLPKRDEMMTLIDEEEGESQAKYLAEKNGLSGGWRGFAIDHQLVDGDAIVFQLVNRTEFKVFIIRAYGEEDDKNDTQAEEDEENGDESNGNKENQNNSDGVQSRRTSKRKRANDKNDTQAKEDEDNGEESNGNKENQNNSDGVQSRRTSKRKRANDKNDTQAKEDEENGEESNGNKGNQNDSDGVQLRRTSKRKRAGKN